MTNNDSNSHTDVVAEKLAEATPEERAAARARLGDREVVPRGQLTQTGATEHGPTYQCPRCEYAHVSEYCDCPECGWAGMCQPEFDSDDVTTDGGLDQRTLDILTELDGIGEGTARRLMGEFDTLRELAEVCNDLPDGYSPPRISRIDGFGPTRARKIAETIDDADHPALTPDGGLATDGGRERVAVEDACIECGRYGNHRCGCCGFPLCGRHHETGGGFCTKFTPISDVPVCAYSNEVYVRPLPRPDGEEPWVLDDGHATTFHLPSPGDVAKPFCGQSASRVTSRPLEDVLVDDHDLCSECAQAARYERRARKRQAARDLVTDGGTPSRVTQDAEADCVLACPLEDCGSTSIRNRRPDTPSGGPSHGRWYCQSCKSYFDEPIERPPRGPVDRNALGPGGKALVDADPDVIPDGGHEPAEVYYTTGWGHSGDDRTLHVQEDCRYLDYARNVKSCPATHAPRGSLCEHCSPDGLTIDDLAAPEPVPDGGQQGGDRDA